MFFLIVTDIVWLQQLRLIRDNIRNKIDLRYNIDNNLAGFLSKQLLMHRLFVADDCR